MSRSKFVVGEQVEVFCDHLRDGQRVNDWLAGKVVQVDLRMAAVQFETDVFSINRLLIPNRILWCAHGSRNIRRLGEAESSASPPAPLLNAKEPPSGEGPGGEAG